MRYLLQTMLGCLGLIAAMMLHFISLIVLVILVSTGLIPMDWHPMVYVIAGVGTRFIDSYLVDKIADKLDLYCGGSCI